MLDGQNDARCCAGNDMLGGAVSRLKETERPIVHSDRECHCRWPGWISRIEKAELERSMSKKGCSVDNSACEGLFGRLREYKQSLDYQLEQSKKMSALPSLLSFPLILGCID